jgi:PBP1b-binding outer membrane lipoprotein LpoB
MKKSILSILSIVVMLSACSTMQNSVTNNNTPPPPPQNQVPAPEKPSSKYQKYKGNDKLMSAPAAAMEKEGAKAESVQMVRDTM